MRFLVLATLLLQLSCSELEYKGIFLALSAGDSDEVSFLTKTVSVNEGDTDYETQVVIFLNDRVYEDMFFDVTILHEQTDGGDIEVLSRRHFLAAGSDSLIIDLKVMGDLSFESDESFRLSITPKYNDAHIKTSTFFVTGTILENDTAITSVAPLFPVHGSRFGDYVYTDFSNVEELSDTDCGAGMACINGGIYKKVIVPEYDSCEDLLLNESLSVFKWRCSTRENPVYFYSYDFKDNKGIKDVINATGDDFKDNSIEIVHSDGRVLARSTLESWWSNTLTPYSPSASGSVDTLGTDYTIYTQIASASTSGIILDGEGISYIMLDGVTLSSDASNVNDCDISSSGIQKCTMKTSRNEGWINIEGDFIGRSGDEYVISICDYPFGISSLNHTLRNVVIDGNGADYGVYTHGCARDTLIYNTDIKDVTYGLRLSGRGLKVNGLRVSDSAYGIYTGSTAWYNYFYDVHLSGISQIGIANSGWNTTFTDLRIDNAQNAIFDSANTTTYLKYHISNITQDAIYLNSSAHDHYFLAGQVFFANVTGFKSQVQGINALVHNHVSGYNTKAFEIREGIDLTDSLLVNNTMAISIEANADDSYFGGKLKFGNNGTDCSITSSGVNPGLSVGTYCQNQGSSDANISFSHSLLNHFVGSVSSDSVNYHGGSSTAAASVLDWLNFENKNRSWVTDDSSFDLSSSMKNSCLSTGTCMVFDWSLQSGASELEDFYPNFEDGEDCPAQLDGNEYINISTGYSSYLKNAIEIMGDGIGNEDGLCNSNEHCIYNKNLGYYQGEGELGKSCKFKDGTLTNSITNVIIYSY